MKEVLNEREIEKERESISSSSSHKKRSETTRESLRPSVAHRLSVKLQQRGCTSGMRCSRHVRGETKPKDSN